MPRKNNIKAKHIPFTLSLAQNKKRYPNEFEALKAAEYQMALNPGLELFTYKDIDGGWYLTRENNRSVK